MWGTDMGESLNKTKQFEEISQSSKNDEYQNSQSIQNTVIVKHHVYWQEFPHLACYRRKGKNLEGNS